ncbi:MAG: patatin-like phospholipase family protein [Anaerolineae bacterium]|nr:patatin-like phospholipase family protein [Anaerolineae bacterium]
MTIRTLILSGGGGRGAFHAGVYSYLMNEHKPRLSGERGGAWEPDIIVGTSIGAVNGAAIAQGITPEALERFWLGLREHHIQGLPPGMRRLTRWVVNRLLKPAIGVTLAQVPQAQSTSPGAASSWPPLPIMPKWISEYLIGRWNNLLDTGPLRETLVHNLKIDSEKLAQSDKTLIINATNVRTGEQVTFCNHPIFDRKTGKQREDVRVGITVNRILASCSIPLVYPWTEDAGEVYWDGAVVSNTPLGASLDVANDRAKGQSLEEPMEVVVVMMTPWWELDAETPKGRQKLPGNFSEAATWALDWALLASFRERLHMTRLCNKLAREQREAGQPVTYRLVDVIVIAPQEFMEVQRIIDYDEQSAALIHLGREAAARAFEEHFGAG